MVFSDLFFLFVFIPAFVICYQLAGLADRRLFRHDPVSPAPFVARNLVLVVFSLLFYAWGEAVYVFLMLGCVVINYLAGLAIAGTRFRKASLAAGITLDLALLGVFKYMGFFSDTLGQFGIAVDAPKVALPIGISFYIFQSISYLVDVYRREAPVQRNFLDLLLYIAMFPQLIAGPIVRYGTVAHELHHRSVSADDFAEGIRRFTMGLGKKVLLANMFSELAEQFLVQGLADLTIWGAWIGLLAFTLQIYFDFSGYSDMAIGIGRCVGFHFCENFNHPYCCSSVTDFWRRWHMSLGSFFRDYVYIPMGGNRRRQALNLLTVWFLTGMWHGASWNFIIWGLYYALVLVIEKVLIFKPKRHVNPVFGHFYSLLAVVIGWGFFYFDDFGNMTTFFSSMLGFRGLEFGLIEETAISDYFWLWVCGIVLCMPVRRCLNEGVERLLAPVSGWGGAYVLSLSRAAVSVCILLLSVALLVGATNNAFIYTRF